MQWERASVLLAAAMLSAGLVPAVSAASDCTFDTTGTTMRLLGDCTTDETILVPDGWTLDGDGHTITAVDPPGDHFQGAVVASAGDEANVLDLTVTADNLANVCDGGADRLRGILFDGASGTIENNTVVGINQGLSGCQEGNAIEVRNAPFDGTHPDTATVLIQGNEVDDYQKTGIVANGDVNVSVEENLLGSADLEDHIAANTIQLGFGALGEVVRNRLDGNQWCGPSFFAASGILVFAADPGGVLVEQNVVRGNSDVGVFVVSENVTVANNKVFDSHRIADCNAAGLDFGVINFGNGAVTFANKVRGFDTPYLVTDGEEDNTVIPDPNQD